jgi:hypothetical protein
VPASDGFARAGINKSELNEKKKVVVNFNLLRIEAQEMLGKLD